MENYVILRASLENERGTVSANAFANALLSRFTFLTLEDDIWKYNSETGEYEQNAHHFIAQIMSDIIPDVITAQFVYKVLYIIKGQTRKNRSIVELPLKYVPVQNGLYNIETNELEPFTSDYFVTNKINAKFDANAKCPACVKFFTEILKNADVPVMQELFGYLLQRDYAYEHFFLFYGNTGGNGKSKTVELMYKFLGKNNASAVGLAQISKDQSAPAYLYHKYANLSAEITPISLTDDTILRALCGNDTIHAFRKFKSSLEFKNYAKIIASCNYLPKIATGDLSTFRRLFIFEFNKRFITGQNADPFLIQKLTTETELSGLLNWSIEGLKRLNENKKFSRDINAAITELEWRKHITPAYAFIQDCVAFDDISITPRFVFKDAFNAYLIENSLPATTEMDLYDVIKSTYPTAIKPDNLCIARIGQKTYRCYFGIKLKSYNNDILANIMQNQSVEAVNEQVTEKQQTLIDIENELKLG